MARVLVINANVTPNEMSRSRAISDLFIARYKKLNPADSYTYLDLNKVDMAKEALWQGNMDKFWTPISSQFYIDQLKEVDKLVIVTPMINWNISPLLKNYIDHIALANQVFSYAKSIHPEGIPAGLLDNLKVQIITTKGSPTHWYSDFIKIGDYLSGLFTLWGSKVEKPLVLGGMDMPPLAGQKPMDVAYVFEKEIDAAAKKF
ncbi:FMN-dependent NADH-azoreductase [Spiroplasma endosymbiont of Othius punctulatus]|uniref:FMN-dependent NADH-azoreductase n=1 Tax=Spiroplasma endosymbiont of Othius punctulatus TaxID=3066289 RepID=UPI0030D4E2AF